MCLYGFPPVGMIIIREIALLQRCHLSLRSDRVANLPMRYSQVVCIKYSTYVTQRQWLCHVS